MMSAWLPFLCSGRVTGEPVTTRPAKAFTKVIHQQKLRAQQCINNHEPLWQQSRQAKKQANCGCSNGYATRNSRTVETKRMAV
jgi:hypothetical protein